MSSGLLDELTMRLALVGCAGMISTLVANSTHKLKPGRALASQWHQIRQDNTRAVLLKVTSATVAQKNSATPRAQTARRAIQKLIQQ
jgi:hypothetical protein